MNGCFFDSRSTPSTPAAGGCTATISAPFVPASGKAKQSSLPVPLEPLLRCGSGLPAPAPAGADEDTEDIDVDETEDADGVAMPSPGM